MITVSRTSQSLDDDQLTSACREAGSLSSRPIQSFARYSLTAFPPMAQLGPITKASIGRVGNLTSVRGIRGRLVFEHRGADVHRAWEHDLVAGSADACIHSGRSGR